MAKHITRWKPDTCDCVLEYEWDDETDPKDRVHTFKTIVPCEAHKHLTGNKGKDGFDAVFDENRRKNKAQKEIIDAYPELTEDIVDDDGATKGKKLKKKHQFNWSFDANRNLQVEITNLPDTIKKADIEKTLFDKFGDKARMK